MKNKLINIIRRLRKLQGIFEIKLGLLYKIEYVYRSFTWKIKIYNYIFN